MFLVMVKCSKCQNYGHKRNSRNCPVYHPGPVHNSLISARKERDHIKKKYDKLVKRILLKCANLPNSFDRKLKEFRRISDNDVAITQRDLEKKDFKEKMSTLQNLDFISSLNPPKYVAPTKKMRDSRSRSSSASSSSSSRSSSSSSTIIEVEKEIKRN